MKALLSYARWWFATRPDAVARRVAWLLPRKVAYWATLRVGAHATTGRYGHQVVPELTFFEAIERWEGA
jgi:hypothetical protein